MAEKPSAQRETRDRRECLYPDPEVGAAPRAALVVAANSRVAGGGPGWQVAASPTAIRKPQSPDTDWKIITCCPN